MDKIKQLFTSAKENPYIVVAVIIAVAMVIIFLIFSFGIPESFRINPLERRLDDLISRIKKMQNSVTTGKPASY